jgi:uncharacterized protein (TIGR03435 family)
MEEASQPFTQPAARVISPVVHSASLPNRAHLLPAILVAMWFCGFVVVLLVRYARWRRISAALREAVPLREGREVEALRRLEHLGGIRKRIELLLSPTSLEPGIFGVVKPLLVWPKGFSEHLQDAHLEAILAHEVWHVRRRDNLAAAMHMVVEAILWFHPLVWWLGARLVEERERACDEEVLELGSERQVYTESILKTCEFCVESPLACMSGVTGADLKKRIVRIMTQRLADKLSLGRKLLLAAVGIAAVAGPVLFGLLSAPQVRAQSAQTTGTTLPPFEVASINPHPSAGLRCIFNTVPERFTTKNVTAKMLIAHAYNVNDFQVSGGPTWINSEEYDINAKEEDSVAQKLRKLPWGQYRQQYGLMVQSFLADRFKLRVSHQTKELPVYALVVAKNGPKLTLTKGPPPGSGPKRGPWISLGRGQLNSIGMSLSDLADGLSSYPEVGGHKVIDQTGLKGNYDISLHWTPDQSPAANVQWAGRRQASNRQRASAPVFRAFDLYGGPGIAWAESGIHKGSGGSPRHRSYREAF